MFHDLSDVDYIGQQLQPKLEQMMLQKEFVVLFWADAGWVRFFTKTPVRTPDEMKRLKLFCWAGEPEQFELMRTMGLNPVSLEVSDILVGLRTGLIDAVPMPPFAALAAQVDTAAPHMLELNYAPLVGAAVIRKDVWDKFPPAMQAQLLTEAQSAGQAIKKDSRAEAVLSVSAMKKRGLAVHVPTAGQVTEWRKFLEDKAYPTVRGKIVPTAIFDEVKQLLEARHATTVSTSRP
jgi:TRAP-type C4-dicarboxylate transport system substrate-binding protein